MALSKMTGEAIYFGLSITLVVSAVLSIINATYYKHHSKTIMGLSFKRDSVEHKKLIKYSEPRRVVLAVVILLVTIIHLIYVVHRILNFENEEFARGLLLIMPAFTGICLVIVLVKLREDFGGD